MPSINDPSGKPEASGSDEARKFKKLLAKRQAERKNDPDVEQWRQQRIGKTTVQTTVDAKALLTTSVDIIKRPEDALRLAERHNSLVVSDDFIVAMELLAGNQQSLDRLAPLLEPRLRDRVMLAKKKPEEAMMILSDLYTLGGDHGFFVKRYSEEYECSRITSDEFLITEGSVPDPLQPARRIPVADCQIRIPAPNETVPLVEGPCNPGDVVYDPDLVQSILHKPNCVAVMEDITCAREFDNRGIAGVVRHAGYSLIQNTVNQQRKGAEIEKVAAAIAGLQGIIRPDGSRIMLRDYMGNGVLLNYRSMVAHTKSRYQAHLAYYQDQRPVSVQIGAEEYKILVRWYMHFQPVVSMYQK